MWRSFKCIAKKDLEVNNCMIRTAVQHWMVGHAILMGLIYLVSFPIIMTFHFVCLMFSDYPWKYASHEINNLEKAQLDFETKVKEMYGN